MPDLVKRNAPSGAGIVLGALAIATAFWLPTLGLILGVIAVGLGAVPLTHAHDSDRVVPIIAVILGALAVVIVVLIIVFASGPASGTN